MAVQGTYPPEGDHRRVAQQGERSDAHGEDWSDHDINHPDEPPSCKCGYNGTPEECAASRVADQREQLIEIISEAFYGSHQDPSGHVADAVMHRWPQSPRVFGKSEAAVEALLAHADDRGLEAARRAIQERTGYRMRNGKAWAKCSTDPVRRLEEEHLPAMERLGGDWNQVARDIRDAVATLRTDRHGPSDALSVGLSITLEGLRDRMLFNSKGHGDDAWWRGHVQGMKDAVEEVDGAALRAAGSS